jgi:hypothetical protein
MQKHQPMKMIDLELRVREALYARLSAEQLQVIHTGEALDLGELLESIAYDVTPHIAYPQTPEEVIRQLTELALDCPSLLVELPIYIASSPEKQHAHLPHIPLKSLYVNVLDRAIRFGLDELDRLASLDKLLSDQGRTLLWAMEKAYVEQGEKGGFWMQGILQHLGCIGWEEEMQVRESVLAELRNLGLIQLRGSRAEIYDLTMQVRVPLVRKHRLWQKWGEFERDEEAITLARVPTISQ